jgi:hypothetical protein
MKVADVNARLREQFPDSKHFRRIVIRHAVFRTPGWIPGLEHLERLIN